jgi:hypothetical protein
MLKASIFNSQVPAGTVGKLKVVAVSVATLIDALSVSKPTRLNEAAILVTPAGIVPDEILRSIPPEVPVTGSLIVDFVQPAMNSAAVRKKKVKTKSFFSYISHNSNVNN